MADEQYTKNRICKETWERLVRFGYTKLIIDDLAADLGISKKTLYKFFPTKKDLVHDVALGTFHEKTAEIRNLIENPQLEYTEKLKKLFEYLSTLIAVIGPVAIDLQRNAPEIVEEMLEYRQKLIETNILGLLLEGIAKGILRSDMNPELIMLIFINVINSIATPRVLMESPYSLKETFETIILVVFNGILTEGQDRGVSDAKRIIVIADAPHGAPGFQSGRRGPRFVGLFG